ncbi:fimbrial protein [Comamonas sp. C24C]
MKKAVLSIAVLSALGFSTVSGAVPSLGPNGIISFAGGLNAETCSVRDASQGNGNGTGTRAMGDLSYSMGTVSASALGTEAVPTVSGSGPTSPVVVDLLLACSNATSLELKLTPTARSGRGIGVTGGATNVQIMLMQGTTALDFTNGSATLFATPSSGSAHIVLNAYYTLQAGKTVSDVVTGTANGSAAYVLSYN